MQEARQGFIWSAPSTFWKQPSEAARRLSPLSQSWTPTTTAYIFFRIMNANAITSTTRSCCLRNRIRNWWKKLICCFRAGQEGFSVRFLKPDREPLLSCLQYHKQCSCTNKNTSDQWLYREFLMQKNKSKNQRNHYTQFINRYNFRCISRLQCPIIA